jgi:CheY-like chemotaxis protein
MALDVLPRTAVDVLIADDDAQLRGSVRLLLESQGMSCAEAADGPETVAIARQLAPRCVLLDLGMPGLDGLTVARRLRSHPRTAHARVHCLTGHADPESRRQAEEAGCELFLTKPVDPTAVVAAVRGWTGLSRTAAEELLDWLEGNGYVPAAVTYEEGVGFAVRIPRPFGSHPQPSVPGRVARYCGVFRSDEYGGYIAVRAGRMPALLAGTIAAFGLFLAGWLGMLSSLEIGVFATLLALLVAIPREERWLPSFPSDLAGDFQDGNHIEFEGFLSERGRFGHRSLNRRIEIFRVIHSNPRRP